MGGKCSLASTVKVGGKQKKVIAGSWFNGNQAIVNFEILNLITVNLIMFNFCSLNIIHNFIIF